MFFVVDNSKDDKKHVFSSMKTKDQFIISAYHADVDEYIFHNQHKYLLFKNVEWYLLYHG